eukprot:scaffold39238_cov36-Phaeocystis_antarctica.AAC.1
MFDIRIKGNSRLQINLRFADPSVAKHGGRRCSGAVSRAPTSAPPGTCRRRKPRLKRSTLSRAGAHKVQRTHLNTVRLDRPLLIANASLYQLQACKPLTTGPALPDGPAATGEP